MRVKLSIACAQNSGPCGAHRSSCKRDRICASADAKATPSINTRFRVTTCRIWSNGAPIVLRQMRKLPGFTDVNSEQQNNVLQASLEYNRATKARLGHL